MMNKLVVAFIRYENLQKVSSALISENIPFMFSEVKGFCREVHLYHQDIQSRVRIEIPSREADTDRIKDIILTNACCGLEEDGCFSIFNIEEFVNFSEYNRG